MMFFAFFASVVSWGTLTPCAFLSQSTEAGKSPEVFGVDGWLNAHHAIMFDTGWSLSCSQSCDFKMGRLFYSSMVSTTIWTFFEATLQAVAEISTAVNSAFPFDFQRCVRAW